MKMPSLKRGAIGQAVLQKPCEGIISEYPDFEPNINRLVSWAWGVVMNPSGLWYQIKVCYKTGQLLEWYELRPLNNNKTENTSMESGGGDMGRQRQGTLWEMLALQEKKG